MQVAKAFPRAPPPSPPTCS